MKRFLIITVLIWSVVAAFSQSVNNTPVDKIANPLVRAKINVPDILGWQTLKCDFHMHTVFSDGSVWPVSRVQEAWLDGLDVVAITDHIRLDSTKQRVPASQNRSYELALATSRELGMVLIKGGEITLNMPPGHLNALFLSDVDLLKREGYAAALESAAKQGAFIQWNHPGWKRQQPDTMLWWPEHQKIYEKGWMHGIEVFNHSEWYPAALDWCLSKNLAVLCDTDVHGTTSLEYDLKQWRRPMTLVFSKDRSQAAIKEALLAGRTVAWFGETLAGKAEYLEALFRASVTIKPAHFVDEKGNRFMEVVNTCDLPWRITGAGGVFSGEQWLQHSGSTIIKVASPVQALTLIMTNAYVGSRQNLQVEWKF
jgi:3',5'-nucleoside bisphosphate phosphatase